MDMNRDGVQSDGNNNVLSVLESPKVVLIGECDVDDESQSLLPSAKGGLPEKLEKPRRKVQWLDKNGSELAEILEFQPSDVSDSDEDEFDPCICRIM